MKILTNQDYVKNEIQNVRIHNLAAAPSAPVEGQFYYDTTTKALYVFNGTTWVPASATTSAGTVTSVSVVASNGFSGSVANPTTVPAITIATTVNGIIKGDGTALSTAIAGTDYITPGGLNSAISAYAQPLDTTLTSLAGSNWVLNAIPVGTGADAVGQVTVGANTFLARSSTGNVAAKTITDFGLSLVDDADGAAARTTMGATTVGGNLFTLADPSTVTFIQINANNTVSALNSASFRTAIGAGTGTVTTISIASANGLSGSVANASSTPVVTLSTTVTGMVKGDGTSFLAAVAGTDYTTPAGVTASISAYAQPLDASLTALAGQNWVANSVPVGTGADTVSQITLGTNTFLARSSVGNAAAKTITDFGLSLVDDGNASAARTTLGATAVGESLFTLTNPSAVTFLQVNANNTVSALDAATFRAAIGAGTGNGTITSVTAAAPVVSSGGTTPQISMPAAGASADGYMTATSYNLLAGATDLNTANAIVRRDGGGGFSAGTITATMVTGLAAPSAASDAVNKTYVDGLVNGLDWKNSVRAASTANVNIAAAPASIDGVTLASGNRVLLKNQTATETNGIYTFSSAGAAMPRSTDADTSAEVTGGMSMFVSEGTANANTQWALTTDDPVNLGVTPLAFIQIGAGSSYTADESTLHLTGTVFSIHTGYTGQTSITTLGTVTTGTWSAGTIALNKGGTGATTAPAARANLGATGKYTALIGTGVATSIAITQATHGLATDGSMVVALYDAVSGAQVFTDVTINPANGTVTFTFAVAPAVNQYRLVIVG